MTRRPPGSPRTASPVPYTTLFLSAGDHLLLPRVVEPYDHALALHRGDLAVAELLVEHAVAALEAAAQRLDLRRDDIDEGRGALAAPRARALQAGADACLAPGAAEIGRASCRERVCQSV